MNDVGLSGLGMGDPPTTRPSPGRRAARRRRRRVAHAKGWLAVLIALAVLVGGGWFALSTGIDLLQARLAPPEDFAGPGTGRVLVEVQEGETAADIGNTLKEKGVVASVDAFIQAAREEPASTGIQVGYYEVRREMKAVDVLAILIDPDNLIRNGVTIPEGLRVTEVLDLLAAKTDFSRAEYQRALDRGGLGLPAYAQDNPEGYLFPATYDVKPDATPASILKEMVSRWQQAAEEVGLVEAADRLGYTPAEVMTVASLVEAEASGDDMPKVARVIYNRLEDTDGGTNGLLQLDATVNYANGRNLGARTTSEERAIDSPYNTYLVPGLPPTPIEAPGLEAMRAAAAPATGSWLYYVTVNLATGETRYAETLEEHQANVELLNEYCRTQSERC